MIVTPRFVFLHLHKSGGSFVNEMLMTCVPGATQVGYHLPRTLVPASHRHLPVLGLVRNPWSYYVSWYAFQSARPQPNALYRICSDHGRLDFASTIRRLLSLGADDALLDELLAALPDRYVNHGLNLPAFALAPIRGTGLGFYSYLYGYLYGAAHEAEGPRVGRMEALREELPRLLDAVGQPIDERMRQFIENAPRRNESRHADAVQVYDPSLRDLVSERDSALIGRYGYRFG